MANDVCKTGGPTVGDLGDLSIPRPSRRRRTGHPQSSAPWPALPCLGVHVGVDVEVEDDHESRSPSDALHIWDSAILLYSSLPPTQLQLPVPHPSPHHYDTSSGNSSIATQLQLCDIQVRRLRRADQPTTPPTPARREIQQLQPVRSHTRPPILPDKERQTNPRATTR